jgi:hypothetical protein
MILAWLLFASFGSALAGEPAPAAFKFSAFQNDGDTVKAEVAEGNALLRITCPRGIGRCTVTAKKGTWPEHVAVLLEGFKELEHFELAIGRMRIEGSRKESGRFTLFFLDDDLDFNKRSQVGTLEIKVEQRKDGIAVVCPARLFADADAVLLSWIDWYR